MKRIICQQCGKKTSDSKQFCEHCLYNVHYRTFNIINSIPWKLSADNHKLATDGEYNHSYTEAVNREYKKWATPGSSWSDHEKSRKSYIKSQKAEWIKRGARPSDREEIMK